MAADDIGESSAAYLSSIRCAFERWGTDSGSVGDWLDDVQRTRFIRSCRQSSSQSVESRR